MSSVTTKPRINLQTTRETTLSTLIFNLAIITVDSNKGGRKKWLQFLIEAARPQSCLISGMTQDREITFVTCRSAGNCKQTLKYAIVGRMILLGQWEAGKVVDSFFLWLSIWRYSNRRMFCERVDPRNNRFGALRTTTRKESRSKTQRTDRVRLVAAVNSALIRYAVPWWSIACDNYSRCHRCYPPVIELKVDALLLS